MIDCLKKTKKNEQTFSIQQPNVDRFGQMSAAWSGERRQRAGVGLDLCISPDAPADGLEGLWSAMVNTFTLVSRSSL